MSRDDEEVGEASGCEEIGKNLRVRVKDLSTVK